jgi:hypothetical protein
MSKSRKPNLKSAKQLHEDLMKKKRLLESGLALEIAIALKEFADSEAFESLGYESMSQYCQEGLGLKYSTARCYLQVAEYIKVKGKLVSMGEWEQIGLTRIRALAMSDPPDETLRGLLRWVRAENPTTREFLQALKKPLSFRGRGG